jgi:DNA gyrase/topoisomerase IV subunit B
MNTPILTAKRGNNVLKFYNNGEFETWKAENGNNTAGWTIKYFKGLGTSTSSSRSFEDKRSLISFIIMTMIL